MNVKAGPFTVAVAVTSFNRVATTLAALEAAVLAISYAKCIPLIVLADASSSDGTGDAVRSTFPGSRVVTVSADHYWAMGMRRALQCAEGLRPDFVLWLNDDTALQRNALETMLTCVDADIVVGAVAHPNTPQHSYGGWLRSGRCRLQLTPAPIRSTAERVDTFNGNVVLITPRACSQLGGLDPSYSHGLADLDYGLRATQAGLRVVQAPGSVGTCARNPTSGTWLDTSLGRRERLALLCSPKGLPPREWWHFMRRHGGLLWPLQVVSPILKVMAGSGHRRPEEATQVPSSLLNEV